MSKRANLLLLDAGHACYLPAPGAGLPFVPDAGPRPLRRIQDFARDELGIAIGDPVGLWPAEDQTTFVFLATPRPAPHQRWRPLPAFRLLKVLGGADAGGE